MKSVFNKTFLIYLMLNCTFAYSQEFEKAKFKTYRIDTSLYYFNINGQIRNVEEAEISYKKYIENPDKNEFVQKFKVLSYLTESNEIKESGRYSTVTYPTIFYLPGGGFLFIDVYNSTSMDFCSNKDLPTLLNEEGYNVIVLAEDDAYYVNPNDDLNRLMSNEPQLFPLFTAPSNQAKYKQYKLSLISFSSVRNIIIDKVNNASVLGIDTDKMLMAGNSSGGILALMYLFLDKNEIPATFATTNCTGIWPPSTENVCSINSSVKNNYWNSSGLPLPPMKGYMVMTASLFKDYTPSLFSNNLMIPNTNKPKLYLVHGTCDELINEDINWIPYKYINGTNTIGYVDGTTNATNNKFNKGYGSNWIYNQVNGILPTKFDRVCGGGHKPHFKDKINLSSSDLKITTGIWNACSITSNPINNQHTFKNWISQFASEVLNNTFSAGIGTLEPEVYSKWCLNDVEGTSPLSQIAITSTGANSYTASFSGGDGAIEYDWLVSYCISGGATTNSSQINNVKTISFTVAPNACRVAVSVVAKSECGYNKVSNYSFTRTSPCNCIISSSSRVGQNLSLDIDEIGLDENWLNFSVNTEQIAKIQLFDISGRLVKNAEQVIPNGQSSFDYKNILKISDITEGIYILYVSTFSNSSSFKLFIKH
jgi:hypothetical protein